MEKYGTYNVFQNIETKEIKRISLTDQKEMTKIANSFDWKLLDLDPEEEKIHENKRNNE